ncbi:hypothetical protein BU26DRAFT_604300 [Trematosphaeria pertusa]|uniref:Uncharacterized protein n=1 Tax=Trematosphaeria pertusa TaxID=390896 RepID=A0A6A6IIK1_9PLEO|nr:uncharacterized protein BU26DRAFT_604300 [Trematosphaeria pertusa]KAF2250039.1 hypothetical protein BU26DRAFT_604300 [Trematosphaeria pertusa]
MPTAVLTPDLATETQPQLQLTSKGPPTITATQAVDDNADESHNKTPNTTSNGEKSRGQKGKVKKAFSVLKRGGKPSSDLSTPNFSHPIHGSSNPPPPNKKGGGSGRVLANMGYRDGKGAVGTEAAKEEDWEYPLNKRVGGKKVLASYAHCQER